MTIIKDAEELLVLIYKKKIAGEEMIQFNDLLTLTRWESTRVINAIEYLLRKQFIDGRAVKTFGSTKTVAVFINDISPEGIDVIEDNDKFQRNFNHTINLGVYQFSWGAQER
ncbi:MAG: hypothetical protein ACP5N3_02070 [Candidatus Nanoarchaeia archaeon]